MSAPTPEQLAFAQALDAATRPAAEKVCGQYLKGLTTLAECIEELFDVLRNGDWQVSQPRPCGDGAEHDAHDDCPGYRL